MSQCSRPSWRSRLVLRSGRALACGQQQLHEQRHLIGVQRPHERLGQRRELRAAIWHLVNGRGRRDDPPTRLVVMWRGRQEHWPRGLVVDESPFRWHLFAHEIRRGVDIVRVSAFLGHATITKTLNIYAHLFDVDHLDVAAIFDGDDA